jgi:hypothetical protein
MVSWIVNLLVWDLYQLTCFPMHILEVFCCVQDVKFEKFWVSEHFLCVWALERKHVIHLFPVRSEYVFPE